jgi:hypothetical protein
MIHKNRERDIKREKREKDTDRDKTETDKKKQKIVCKAWWHTPIIPTQGRLR